MNKCPTHKKTYSTEPIAEDALIQAWITYHYAQGNGPVGVYKCDECGFYHLTSKGPMNKKLSDMIASGEIKKLKEAGSWLDKIKRKDWR
jgi:hypothetical protein